MAKKIYEMWLDDRTYIVVDFDTVRERLVAFVVRLMLITATGAVDVARYDTAHGTPHRDMTNRSGRVISKDWLFDFDFQSSNSHFGRMARL
jgi:hypothetical protein